MKINVIKRLLASTLLLAATGTVMASDLCSVPEADRQPISALEAKLVADGWTIKNMKVDDGCYEAYAINAEGQKVEVYFDPKTFEIVKSEVD